MCPNRDWFTTYEAINGGVVLKGNNVSCKTVGKSTIRIKMHDAVIGTLTDARHILDLRKNLIFLGTLDNIWCNFLGEGGILRITKDSLMVMKEKNISSLRKFNEFCKKEGIIKHRTVSRTPRQNGVAKRMNRTLLEKTRCMIFNAGLGKEYWVEAVNTTCYLVNRLPSTAISCKTPEEVWSGDDFANTYGRRVDNSVNLLRRPLSVSKFKPDLDLIDTCHTQMPCWAIGEGGVS
ncbi:uncharacterized protein LOC109845717 [Asparagus officinalis]|uniref:uncharacterized protein LOC109845717 n=1 Tax=Asparagus officinalis TaxID=4686 RepID=UPI00098E002C|nr:uncharacterized protein LOC109845717 [Asparagus officinalis]